MSGAIYLTLAALIAGALSTTGFMLYAAQPWSSTSQPFGLFHIVFIAWAITPYLVGSATARYFRHHRRSMIVLLLGFTISVGSAAFIYYDSLFVHIDAQGALIFLFFPLYQLVFTLLLIFIAALFRTRTDRAGRQS